MSVDVDTDELRRFAADLNSASIQAASQVRAIVSKGALAIKNQLQSEMSASAHFKGAASSISYDLVSFRDGLEAQIGPESGGPGALANIAYFGTSRGGGTVPDPLLALEAEVPKFERAVNELLGRVV